tara:strand:- start:141700 stop:141894 length:195 start_codon:yes stop_codon:yes gene_type:complete
MKLSNQAAGALMMALQKCLLEQRDITGLLKDMVFEVDDGGELTVSNPPLVSAEAPKSKVLIPDA